MKKTIKKYTTLVLSIIVLSSFSACEDDLMFEELPEDPEAPRMVSLGFSLSLELHNKLQSLKAELHTYVKDGYTVVIADDNIPDKQYVDVNLEEILIVEVTGDILVTIFHPSFKNNTLEAVAYFGIEELTVHIVEETVNAIDLKLVQGFVLVKVENGLNKRVKSVKILGQSAELDVVYYTNAPIIFVNVKTKNKGSFRGLSENVLGEGVQYNVPTAAKTNDLLYSKLVL